MARRRPFNQKREIVVWGIDSETQQGPPISLQFHSYDQPRASRIYQVKGPDALDVLIRHIERFCDDDKHYRLYGHYLEFDMLSFFWPIRKELVRNEGSFDFTHKNWRVVGCYGRPTFARMTSEDGHLIEIVDSSLWFRGSLDHAAELYCPNLRKLERPEGLGEKWFSVKDSGFAKYAMRDAEIAAVLGRLVEGFHEQMELKPSMSLASQAAQIFKVRYIADPIVQCPPAYMEAAIAAYHGGKNNMMRHASPAWHEDAAMYDISSAYPWAMSELPAFTDENGYKEINLPASAKRVPEPGIYRISGAVSDCEWPIIFTHDFKPLRNCKIEDLWLHGYELNEALRTGEFKPSGRIKGCCYDTADHGEAATARFSRDFYKNKSEAKNPIDRHMYKILLNCLSGKFIQTREQEQLHEDGTVTREHVAGGLFQPFIAGAITSHTRAAIHRIEHIFAARHTATDGIIAPYRKDFAAAARDAKMPVSGLGSLNEEMRGNVILLRTKLYIGYTKDDGKPSRIFEDWRIKKYALHGFQGNVSELEEMIASGRRWYIAPHRIGLREAVKHGTMPNSFVQRSMSLQVGGIQWPNAKLRKVSPRVARAARRVAGARKPQRAAAHR